MRLKRVLSVALSVLIAISLCGCDIFTAETEQLIMPPALTGDMKPIGEALSSSIEGEYTLKYPLGGAHRSPVILNDINGDNIFEAFAFYSQNDGEMDCMHLNVICRKGERWESVFDQKVQAGGVDRIDFCDLNGDGTLEIIVGWTVYASSEKQLAVYSLENGVLSQRFVHEYANFICCDLDGNRENELFIHRFDAVNSINEALLFTLEDAGVLELSGCGMDKTARTASVPLLSVLSDGTPAIYIDEIKDAGMITEVIYYSKGALVNPLLEAESGENIKTLRANALPSSDINNDEIIEIPVSEIMKASEGMQNAEKVYYTKWCSFNGKALTSKLVTLFNTSEYYFLRVPEKWIGNIALIRDNENRVRTVYEYNAKKNKVGKKLVYFEAVPIGDFEDFKAENAPAIEISRNTKYVFVGEVQNTKSALAITEKELKEMFFLYDGAPV
ncbi:MAG: hypothetical protein PUF48_05215 [Oscillospiraceae bacterium]|nr:hypothetical protein [Oscillospiraceae bacterium]